MWGPGLWAGSMWGFWWILPVIGLAISLGFLILAFGFIRAGRGFMCMGGHRSMASDEVAEMRREIHALLEEVNRLKASR
jgi:hypothetical protein